MAVTGAIFKRLYFDGEDSGDYGVYITGEAAYNAPERSVEMISIPGRNGAYALDNGRFENMSVSYPAGIYADNEEDFAAAMSAFRNALCSKKGYFRLEDDYNPDEYRLAIYKSGLEAEPFTLKATEFNLVFECMPQRFLKSGEVKQTLTSGDTLTNPTRFDARPMLEAYGHGNIAINGWPIVIENAVIGRTYLGGGDIYAGITIDPSLFNAGDVISISDIYVNFQIASDAEPSTVTHSESTSGLTFEYWSAAYGRGWSAQVGYIISGVTLTAGTDAQMFYRGTVTINGVETAIVIYIQYSGNTITLSIATSAANKAAMCNEITVDSTVSALGSPTYIDLDIGAAYYYRDGVIVSANSAVQLPAELPTLTPGANEITFDVDQLDIIPRWWKV